MTGTAQSGKRQGVRLSFAISKCGLYQPVISSKNTAADIGRFRGSLAVASPGRSASGHIGSTGTEQTALHDVHLRTSGQLRGMMPGDFPLTENLFKGEEETRRNRHAIALLLVLEGVMSTDDYRAQLATDTA